MKKIFYITCILLLLCQTSFADDYKDSNKYDITDESNYAILMYDLKKSLVQQFGRDDEAEGELRASFVFGNLNLTDIKKEIILKMQEEGFTSKTKKLDVKKLEHITQPFVLAVSRFLPTVKSLELSDAFIHMYMQIPEFYGKQWEKDYSAAMLHNAENIAISRFNNKYWFNQIVDCYQKNSSKKDMVTTIEECSQKYQQLVTEETGKILKDLQAHKYLFENLYQISPDEPIQKIQLK